MISRIVTMVSLSLVAESALSEGPNLAALMPLPEDRASMYWADGFPGVVEDAPWLRVIETGYFAFVLNTKTLEAPHFGTSTSGWHALPAAKLNLAIDVNGKSYRCVRGGEWTRKTGPRLIESGRFFQRGDITDLVFESADGEKLNAAARLETAAWPDRLGLVFTAEPGAKPIEAGRDSFGIRGGGFGFDGTNAFEIPHASELDTPEFTLEFHAFIPDDYRVSETVWPWLVCKNRNESVNGNYGIMIIGGKARARMNIGGGTEGQVNVGDRDVKLNAWNHLAMSYDGTTFRFYLNGAKAGEAAIGKTRIPNELPLVFGRRADNSGDGYRIRGIVDEIRIYDRALPIAEIRQRNHNPTRQFAPTAGWSFLPDGEASTERPKVDWKDPTLELTFFAQGKRFTERKAGNQVGLSIDPVEKKQTAAASPLAVNAGDRPSEYDPVIGWTRINLDGIDPIVPENGTPNDAMEKIPFSLSNTTQKEQVARLLFEKSSRGIRQKFGVPITGISAILCDANGSPTGIPVQLSKNWHNDPNDSEYSRTWFHGLTQVRLPAQSEIDLELRIVYGHWGGVPAASHAQLSLIGWGYNQRWDQSALGSWGESFCYNPAQVLGECTITDVRPLMVTPMKGGRWNWTSNVGGGDFFRVFDPSGTRLVHRGMNAHYRRYGPCLTEVVYSGKIGNAIRHSETISLSRTDDLVRATYRLQLDVDEPLDFSRFVIFQVGADTYNFTEAGRIAVGNESGLVAEWTSQPGGDIYRSAPHEATGNTPWISQHESTPRNDAEPKGAWANRGIVIREWSARLGGKPATPWVAERGVTSTSGDTSTTDIVAPPGVPRLEKGDYVDAVVEYIVMPKTATDYYGPNQSLRSALQSDADSWRMIHREATGNSREVSVENGKVEQLYPDVRLSAADDEATFTISGGLGYVPITITGLTKPNGYEFSVDGVRLDQSVHGNDFWQTDFDPESKSWSITVNLPVPDKKTRRIEVAIGQ